MILTPNLARLYLFNGEYVSFYKCNHPISICFAPEEDRTRAQAHRIELKWMPIMQIAKSQRYYGE